MIAQSIDDFSVDLYIYIYFLTSTTGVLTMYFPSSSAFFQGQIDAENGHPTPEKPKYNASFDEKMYFRGFVQQERKMTKLAEIQVSRVDLYTFA